MGVGSTPIGTTALALVGEGLRGERADSGGRHCILVTESCPTSLYIFILKFWEFFKLENLLAFNQVECNSSCLNPFQGRVAVTLT